MLRKMTLLGTSWSLFITKQFWINKSKVVGMDGLEYDTHGEDEKCYKVVVPNCENKIVPGRLTRGIQACASQINFMGMKLISWLIRGTREGSFEDGNVT